MIWWTLVGLLMAMRGGAWAEPPRGSLWDQLDQQLTAGLETSDISPDIMQTGARLTIRAMLGLETEAEEAGVQGPMLCHICEKNAESVIEAIKAGELTKEQLFDQAASACFQFKVSSEDFCKRFMGQVQDQIWWVLTNTELTANDVCGTILQRIDCHSRDPKRNWTVPMPQVPKPPIKDAVIPSSAPVLKVLHLSDTHFDPDYQPGSNANCPEKVFCCRNESGEVEHRKDAAGYWGDYRSCDLPRWTLEALYAHIRDHHKDISFIIWTGDLVPHDVSRGSQASSLQTIREAVRMVQEYFPGLPVYPAVGNHETHPVNAFPQPYIENEFSISWLYDELASLWSAWLPQDAVQSVMNSASYIVDALPKLRILSVNSNYCYGFNWWLLHDSHDIAEELEWMARELQRAEDDEVFVYIISHIPSGHTDCLDTWSHEHNKIISRYEGVIAGIFYGHTHNDEFQLFFDDPAKPTRASEVAFVAQSQTSYSDLNPGYKIYSIDGVREDATFSVLDHENWYLNLAKANKDMKAEFKLLYRAKEDYGMKDLSAASHFQLVKKMKKPKSKLFHKYFWNMQRGRRKFRDDFHSKQKNDILCRTLVSDTSDKSLCDTLLE